ncbi:MAG: hypothetical protein JXQ75_16495 [Phycisphaerae bacterium]|nr:hypothetical protein [Phycisphaerae bacterium]
MHPCSMLRRSRSRRRLKYTGLVLSALFLVLWGISTFIRFAYTWTHAQGFQVFVFGGGGFFYYVREGPREFEWIAKELDCWRSARDPVIVRPRHRQQFGLWLPTTESRSFDLSGLSQKTYSAYDFIMPFWPLFAITAIPTAFLIWRQRRQIPLGCCQKCGYNLTGNTSGICPECGTHILKDNEGPDLTTDPPNV